MTEDYFKRVVATDIITKAMQIATARDELTQKAHAEHLARQIIIYCQANNLTPEQLLDTVLEEVKA